MVFLVAHTCKKTRLPKCTYNYQQIRHCKNKLVSSLTMHALVYQSLHENCSPFEINLERKWRLLLGVDLQVE